MSVAVFGAGGYVGGVLLKLLSGHPQVSRIAAVSRNRARQKVAATHPRLRASFDLEFVAEPPSGRLDVAFFATPAGVAMEQARDQLESGALVVDCSPDFRLGDQRTWEKWYGKHSDFALVEKAVYGLVELRRDELATARLIAAPGCYATAVQLAAAPIVKALAAKDAGRISVVAACVSGTSGAGRRQDRAELLLAEADGNYQAYALGGHRHAPEILQGIGNYAGTTPRLSFVPHLLPVARGMFATVHVSSELDCELDCAATLASTYKDDTLIDILEAGMSPQLVSVVNTSLAQLSGSPTRSNDHIALCAIDNLGKGAAGQAVQAANIALGLDESAGLS